jgi:hypothetical protein
MHKDPPPGLLERAPRVIVIYGLLTGFVAGVVVFGVWSLFTANPAPRPEQPSAIADRVR